jgi:hypothetical protein
MAPRAKFGEETPTRRQNEGSLVLTVLAKSPSSYSSSVQVISDGVYCLLELIAHHVN